MNQMHDLVGSKWDLNYSEAVYVLLAGFELFCVQENTICNFSSYNDCVCGSLKNYIYVCYGMLRA